MSEIPLWLIKAHNENLFALQNCINNPSFVENELTIEMYKQLLNPDSGFSDFKYIILIEWQVNPYRPQLGKGDLVLTNGKNILVVEVKRIKKCYSKQVQLKNLTKVIRQARYYALMIKKFRDRQNFPIPEYNQYFQKSKIHAAFYTNLDTNIILVKHPKKISSSNKKRFYELPKGLTTQEVINTNKVSVELIEEKTPKKQDRIPFANVKVEQDDTKLIQQNLQERSNDKGIVPQKSSDSKKEKLTDNYIVILDQFQPNLQSMKTPINSGKKDSTKFQNNIGENGFIQTFTDSKNRKFLVDSINYDDQSFIYLQSDQEDQKKEIIDLTNFRPQPQISNIEQTKVQNDIIFLNEIKPFQPKQPDIVLLHNENPSPFTKLKIPIQSDSPKIVPFNLQLALEKNLNIDSSLSQFSYPVKQTECQQQNDESISSFCSYIDQIEELDQHIDTQCNNNSLGFHASYYNTFQFQQTLKDIVEQKKKEIYLDNLNVNNQQSVQQKNNLEAPNKLIQYILGQNTLPLEQIQFKPKKEMQNYIEIDQSDQNSIIINQNIQNQNNTTNIIINTGNVTNDFNIKANQNYPVQSLLDTSLCNIMQQKQQQIVQQAQQMIEVINSFQGKNNQISQNYPNQQEIEIQNIFNEIPSQKQKDNSDENLNFINFEQSEQNNENENQKELQQSDSFYQLMLEQIQLQELIEEEQSQESPLLNESQIKKENEFLENNNIKLISLNEQIAENLNELNKIDTNNSNKNEVSLFEDIINKDKVQTQKRKIIKLQVKKDVVNLRNEEILNSKQSVQINFDQKLLDIQRQIKIKQQLVTSNSNQLKDVLGNRNSINQKPQKDTLDVYQKERLPLNLLNQSTQISKGQIIENINFKELKIVKPDEILKGKKFTIVSKQPFRQKHEKFIINQ